MISLERHDLDRQGHFRGQSDIHVKKNDHAEQSHAIHKVLENLDKIKYLILTVQVI